jgi:tetratricopeptide (TPR) repeat protein
VRAAIALGHPDPGELHFIVGDIETRAGNYPAALGALNTAAAEGTDWRIERAIGDVYARWGRWALASASLEAALEIVTSADERATVLADLAVVAVRAGRSDDARSFVVEALDAADEDAEVAARVANVAGLVLDDPEQLLRAIAHARRTNRREDEAAALNNLALAYARRNRTDEAVALAERSLALLDRTGDRHRRAAIHGNLADILHQAGDEMASREHLKQAASLFAEVGVGDWEPEIWKLTGW